MNVKIFTLFIAISMILVAGITLAKRGGEGGRNHPDAPVIYVENQDLYYDSIVTADPLPYNGHNSHTFQKLYVVDGQLTCMYGPGDPEYNGGRWWLDLNGNDVMDPEDDPNDPDVQGDHYFNCPLLGPGRDMP